jgi:hypothetical protein
MDKEEQDIDEAIFEDEIRMELLASTLVKEESAKKPDNLTIDHKDGLLPQFQNSRTELMDIVSLAAQQFYALKAAGVEVPDIFDKRDQEVAEADTDVDRKSSAGLFFDYSFPDEEGRSSSPKDKHLKLLG